MWVSGKSWDSGLHSWKISDPTGQQPIIGCNWLIKHLGILAVKCHSAVIQMLLISRPTCSTRIVCISGFRETPVQLNSPEDYKKLLFFHGRICQKKWIPLCTAFISVITQYPKRVSIKWEVHRALTMLHGEGILALMGMELDSSAVLGNIQIGFCRYLENIFDISWK